MSSQYGDRCSKHIKEPADALTSLNLWAPLSSEDENLRDALEGRPLRLGGAILYLKVTLHFPLFTWRTFCKQIYVAVIVLHNDAFLPELLASFYGVHQIIFLMTRIKNIHFLF